MDNRLKVGDSVIVARNTHPAFKNKKRFYKQFIGQKAVITSVDEKIGCNQVNLKFENETIQKMNIDDGNYLFMIRDLDRI